MTNREAVPDYTSALFCRWPGNHCHSYLMCLTGTLESAHYVMSILPQVPHSRVIRKQSRGLGSLAWMVLVTMTAAASLG